MNQLKKARLAAEMTQEALSALAGVSRVTIARIESGSTASVRTLLRLARALGCQMEQLLDTEDATHAHDDNT